MGSVPRRVFVFGMDGAPYGLMQELFSRGVLKNLSEIAQKGSCRPMSTTIPDVSSVAWTTFMTGVNPGRHGIYGFMDLKPGTYSTYFPNTSHVRSPSMWQRLGKEGKRSIIINMPSTYPAQDLQGILVSGFVAIDLEKATFPKHLVPWLKEIGYMLDVDSSKAREKPDEFFQDLHASLKQQEVVFRKLMKEERWDLFAAIVTGTDRLHHFFWNAFEEERSPFHDAFLNYYRAVDALAGRLYDDLNGEAVFLALSDHGFCRLRRDVFVNRWLEEQGYLYFPGDKRGSIADADMTRTRAFCLDPGRIYLNVRRRFPQGSVVPGKPFESLIEELAQALGELAAPSEDGSPKRVIRRVFRKEDLYTGPFLSSAPDLVLLAEPGSNLKGATKQTRILDSEGPFTGMHTQDDAFFLSDCPASSAEDIHILDISKTVMTLLGASEAESIEGHSVVTNPCDG